MNLLDRYVARTILAFTMLVTAVLLVLGSLFTFIGQQDDIGVGSYDTAGALLFTALNVPDQAFELLPLGALIGALIGLGNLARGSELVVMRAAGLSTVRIAGAAGLAGLVVMGAMWALGEYVAPPLGQYAMQHKVFSKYADVSAGLQREAWIKDGNRMINIQQQSAENMFGGVYIITLGPGRTIESIGRAESATLGEGSEWKLGKWGLTRFEGDRAFASRVPSLAMHTDVNPGFLGLAVTDPGSLPVRGLRQYVDHLRRNELESRSYEIAMWSRVSRTVAAVVLCILAVPFSFGPMRSAGAGAKTVVGMLIGIVYHLVTRTLENSGQIYGLDPLVVAWAPVAALTGATAFAIWRAR
jgi:lipopolysaccharide export system permease protein